MGKYWIHYKERSIKDLTPLPGAVGALMLIGNSKTMSSALTARLLRRFSISGRLGLVS